MRTGFHEDLDRISDDLVQMATLVGTAMSRATIALLDADLQLAESVIAADGDIDTLRDQIDELAVDLLARQQPVATDLRMVVTAMQMSSSIERMGDLAEHLAKVARLRYPEHAVPPELREVFVQMSKITQDLAERVAAAIADKDVTAAEEIEKRDQELDELHRQIFAILVDPSYSSGVEAAIDATLLSRYFERFGDHATSVAYRIVYLVTGRRANAEIND